MMLIYGAATVFLLWWVLKTLQKANPRYVAKMVKYVGAGVLGVLAAFLLLRGRVDMAILLGGIAAGLLGWGGIPLPSWRLPGGSGPTAADMVSRVRSKAVEMELRHDTGEMSGRIVSGRFAGRALHSLEKNELILVLGDLRDGDADGARLLEVYLDRRFPGWRENADPDMHARQGAHFEPSAMSEQEAYEILGLQPGASEVEIRRAHRTLIKRLHPDQGGSTYLAARVNQAKDLLLSRHR